MASPSQVPPAIPGYEVFERVGEGGMAEVWLAQRRGSRSLVVIKRLRGAYAHHRSTRERLLREAQIGSFIDHPNVARVVDAGFAGEVLYVAAEYVAGRDLEALSHQQARNRQILPAGVVTRVFAEVLEGLHAAHEARGPHGRDLGLVHRDLSPRNIQLGFEGEIKIIDFGLARAELGAYYTDPGTILGTYRYMSPEQAIGEPVDRRSDLFTLGTSMYELYTGHWLFDEPDKESILRAIIETRLPSPSFRNPRLPPELDEVIMKALSFDPAERYLTAKEMGEALHAAVPDWVATPNVSLARLMQDVFPHEALHARERHLLARHRGSNEVREEHVHVTLDQTSMQAAQLNQTQILERRRRSEREVTQEIQRPHRKVAATLAEATADRSASTLVKVPGREEAVALGPVDADVRAAIEHRCDPIGLIGQGGMGRIYLAHVNGEERLCVVKLLEPGLIQPDSDLPRRRFEREAHILSWAQHRAVPRCLAYDDSNSDFTFMIMELVDGVDLLELAEASGGRLELRIMLPLALEYLDALHHLHELRTPDGEEIGLVHRDISPHNLMTTFAGEARLIDLGIARRADEALTAVGNSFLGKPRYASPEQPLGQVDRRSDIFSFGMVLLELLSGRPVVPEHLVEPFEILKYVASHRAPRLRDLRPDLPPDLDEVLFRATAFEPGERYPTAAELRDALDEATRGERRASEAEIGMAATRVARERRDAYEELLEQAQMNEASVSGLAVPSRPETTDRTLRSSLSSASSSHVPRWAVGLALVFGGAGLGAAATVLSLRTPAVTVSLEGPDTGLRTAMAGAPAAPSPRLAAVAPAAERASVRPSPSPSPEDAETSSLEPVPIPTKRAPRPRRTRRRPVRAARTGFTPPSRPR
ncbi:MAG: serine/threonine-protein kinase, partial [Myxococcota bacterium]